MFRVSGLAFGARALCQVPGVEVVNPAPPKP